MIFLKLSSNHNWHKFDHVAKVIKIMGSESVLYGDHGRKWEGKFNLSAKSWVGMGYEECSEEEALAVLKLKKF
jgi:hypothetical protein